MGQRRGWCCAGGKCRLSNDAPPKDCCSKSAACWAALPAAPTFDQRGVLVDQPQPIRIYNHGQRAAPHRAHHLRRIGA